jgi:23S rRNA pseudouridine1911/1915/1917 synthase
VPDDGFAVTEEIPAALAGERLDRVVAIITGASRSVSAALIAAGGARVDGGVVATGKLRLREGQRVEVDPSRLPVTAVPAADNSVAVAVVHEDAHIVVVDKPGGLVVHPGAGHAAGTLVNGLLARYPEIADVGDPMRPGIVHRLDVGTSGLLVVARTPLAYTRLVEALAARTVGRTYRALVWGHPESPNGTIDAPVGRDLRDPMRMAVVVDGRPARTRFRVVSTYRDVVDAASLECRLETGRTHQIRVHLAAIGHPVLGDATYGGVRSGLDAPRPMLHAAALAFRHPVTDDPLQFVSEVPADIGAVIRSLGAADVAP